jgi:lipoprotein-anchoring transpeptidase ErfK/SrfK
MKSNVVLASLIAALSLHSAAFAQTAPTGDKPAVAAVAAPADAGIAGAEKPKPKVRRAAPAPEPSAMDRFTNFFRSNSNVQASAPSAPGNANARAPSANAQGQAASQVMLQRAASSYSTSSNALGFGLYRVTPREVVAFKERHTPGTILVRQREKRLYYVNGDGTAIRYAIAVGREGAAWSGTSSVSDKREWPGWTPTPGILAKQPDLPRHVDGGPANPMGARALYLGQTMYRIHGTNEPWRIGEEASSGCIRLTNDDIIDLYNRTRLGATVIVTR